MTDTWYLERMKLEQIFRRLTATRWLQGQSIGRNGGNDEDQQRAAHYCFHFFQSLITEEITNCVENVSDGDQA